MNKFLSVLYFVALSATINATDYCKPGICNGNGKTHIGCKNDGEFSSNCPDDAEIRDMTDSLKKLILSEHNEKRNFIAGGGDDDLKPACRMATIEWDDELAKLAELNVLQCTMKHDKCHNTDDFKYSGQNLGVSTYTGDVNDSARIKQFIQMWYDEKENVSQSIINKYPNNYKGPAIGHFTVMMVDRNIRVGCAASVYSNKYLFACNYASTNMVGFPIYKSCNKPAVDCKTGTNPSYENLCSTSESYNVNKFF
ncbi:antigen 5 like allergen Cul n 1-like [Cochliomyia hominivorax]